MRARSAAFLTIPEILDRRTDRSGGPDACWPWTASMNRRKAGYGRFTKDGVDILAHRVAWEIANGQQLDADERVLHRCDNPICCNPAHLRRGTQAENVKDMDAKGRSRRVFGKEHGMAILTEAQVIAIFLDPRPRDWVARSYGIGKSTVMHIWQRHHWRYLTKDLVPPKRLDGRRERWRHRERAA